MLKVAGGFFRVTCLILACTLPSLDIRLSMMLFLSLWYMMMFSSCFSNTKSFFSF